MSAELFTETDVRSFPPHLDPDLVSTIEVSGDTDRDHVGVASIGRYGNNATVEVLRVKGLGGALLHAEQFPNSRLAHAAAAEIRRVLAANRQALLGLD